MFFSSKIFFSFLVFWERVLLVALAGLELMAPNYRWSSWLSLLSAGSLVWVTATSVTKMSHSSAVTQTRTHGLSERVVWILNSKKFNCGDFGSCGNSDLGFLSQILLLHRQWWRKLSPLDLGCITQQLLLCDMTASMCGSPWEPKQPAGGVMAILASSQSKLLSIGSKMLAPQMHFSLLYTC